VLPRRVGDDEAARLTEGCLPIGSEHAGRTGLVDDVVAGPSAEFEDTVLEYAARLAGRADHDRLLERKRASRRADEQRKPLDAYRAEELAEMSRDIFDDRNGFSAAREAFVTKRRPESTPTRIATHRPAVPPVVAGDAAARRAS
jgi:putative two-component system hydrogenase maturation factor HypX/HoxX